MLSRVLLQRLRQPLLRVRQARPWPVSTRAKLLPASTLPNTPIFRALQDHNPDNLAVVQSLSSHSTKATRSFDYGTLLTDVLLAKEKLELMAREKTQSLAGERVAFLAENSYDYVGL